MSKPATPQPAPEKRAAPRASVPVEVVLKCPDKSGKSFIEKTRTADVSRTGARLLTEHDVNQGARMQVAIPHLKRMSTATVARIGNQAGDRREIGIAVDETGDFWGVPLPAEGHAPPAAAAGVPPQAGAEPGAGARGVHPSLALVQELLTATERRPTAPSADPDQARSAIEQSLGEALQQLNEQAVTIMKNLQEVIAEQADEHLRQSIAAAVQQMEAAASDMTTRSQQVLEQRIQALTDSMQEQLRAQVKEHEAQLAASAAKLRRELARRLADLSSEVGEG